MSDNKVNSYIKKDIWDTDANVIVIPVNCVGVMGAGLAKQCKTRHPTVYDEYKLLCSSRTLRYDNFAIIKKGNIIFVMLPTKNHWRDKSILDDVISNFSNLIDHLTDMINKDDSLKLKVAVPMLGAGLGGLNESEVRLSIENICKHKEKEGLSFVVC